LDKGKGNKATNKTLFEIGSTTKVFTGTLMANAMLEDKIG
jgi:CubicO group peptidase (beta-lactamase class C family)